MFSLKNKMRGLLILIGILVVIGIAGCSGGGGGGGTPPGGGNQTPAGAVQVVSALGVSSGVPIVASIGPTGGMVTSPSGSFTLTIPAGAVSSAATFTVQPLTSTTTPWKSTTNGFAIDGLASLTQPVSLSIAYTGGGIKNPSADTLFISLQDSKGAWWYFGNAAWDGTSLSVTLDPAVLSALTGVSLSSGAALSGVGTNSAAYQAALYIADRAIMSGPEDIFVNQSKQYQLTLCDLPVNSLPLSALANSVCQPLQLTGGASVTWKVAGISGGNATVGLLINDQCPSTGCFVWYQAPAKVPSPNSVEVDAVIKFNSNGVRIYTDEIGRLVTIHDAGKYHVAASFTDPKRPICANVSATINVSDSFDLDLQSLVFATNYAVSNISNGTTLAGSPVYDPSYLSGFKSQGITLDPITLQGSSLEVLTVDSARAISTSDPNQPPPRSEIVGVGIDYSASNAGCLVYATASDGSTTLMENSMGNSFSTGGAFPLGFNFYSDPNAFDQSGSQVVYESDTNTTLVNTTPPNTTGFWKFTVTQVP